MARESKVSDAMKAFDRGEYVTGKKDSAYSKEKPKPKPKMSDAEKMDRGMPVEKKAESKSEMKRKKAMRKKKKGYVNGTRDGY